MDYSGTPQSVCILYHLLAVIYLTKSLLPYILNLNNITFMQYLPLTKIFIIFRKTSHLLPYSILTKTLLETEKVLLVPSYDMHVITIIYNSKILSLFLDSL